MTQFDCNLQGVTTRAQYYNCQGLQRDKRYSRSLNNKYKRAAPDDEEALNENIVEENEGKEWDFEHDKRDASSVCTKETGNFIYMMGE